MIKKNYDVEKLVDFVLNDPVRIIKPLQVREEILSLLKFVKKSKPKNILEIGTAKGGTLFLFSKIASSDATIISVDLPKGEFGGGYPKWKKSLYKSFKKENQKIHLLRENSHSKKTLEKVKKILGDEKLDFLFIDGDHSYGGVKKDFEMYSELVGEKGVIAFHDVAEHKKEFDCHVDKLWKEIKKENKFIEFINDYNQGWGGIGVVIK